MRAMFIVWKDEYNLGIPIIDEHHRGIVTDINSLYYAMKDEHGAAALKPIVHMVKEYTRIHFTVEEAAMRRSNFPGVPAHHRRHAGLLRKVKSVGAESLINQEPTLFLEFLKDWWINHICVEDRKFADYLREEKKDLDA